MARLNWFPGPFRNCASTGTSHPVNNYWYIRDIFKNEFIKVNTVENVVEMDTYEDPEKAFEETKRALLHLSSKLNQSSVYATQFSKFEEHQNNLKQN